jgi:hypothetical protein
MKLLFSETGTQARPSSLVDWPGRMLRNMLKPQKLGPMEKKDLGSSMWIIPFKKKVQP